MFEALTVASRSTPESRESADALLAVELFFDGDERALLLHAVGYLHLELGETAACRTAFGRGMEAATTGAARGVLEAGTANLELRLHSMSGAERWVVRALRHLGPDDSSARCLALLIAAWTNGHRGEPPERDGRLPRRRGDGRPAALSAGPVDDHDELGPLLPRLRDTAGVAAVCPLGRERGTVAKLMKSYELQAALESTAWLLTNMGQWDEASSLLDETLGSVLPADSGGAKIVSARAILLLLKGEWAEAASAIAHVLRVQHDPTSLMVTHLSAAQLHVGTGTSWPPPATSTAMLAAGSLAEAGPTVAYLPDVVEGLNRGGDPGASCRPRRTDDSSSPA